MQANFFIIVVIVFGLILFVAEHFTRKKHEKNLAYAQSRGWRYHKQHPTLARAAVQVVGGGRRSNSFRMVFEGQSAGRPFLAGTARWTESSGSGKNRSSETHYRRVVLRPMNLMFAMFGWSRKGSSTTCLTEILRPNGKCSTSSGK